MAKNIRLKIPGESFWATQYDDLPSNQAEINNHLLSDKYKYGDRVEFDENRNVVRLIKTREQVSAEGLAPTDKSMAIEALIDELISAARLLGSTQAAKMLGTYTVEDARFEGSMHELIAKYRAAIEQYGREREAASVPAPPFDPAAEPPWHRSDMGPAGRGSGEPRVIGHIRIGCKEHPFAQLDTAFDAHGEGWVEGTPFYAAPQTRAPLTEEQIMDLLAELFINPRWPSTAIDCAHAIEQAHNIRNPHYPCRSDGRCQYAIDHSAEDMGHCPAGKCVMPEGA